MGKLRRHGLLKRNNNCIFVLSSPAVTYLAGEYKLIGTFRSIPTSIHLSQNNNHHPKGHQTYIIIDNARTSASIFLVPGYLVAKFNKYDDDGVYKCMRLSR